MLLLQLVAASEREAWRARRLVNEGLLLVHGGSRMDERGSLMRDRPPVLSLGAARTFSCSPRAIADAEHGG